MMLAVVNYFLFKVFVLGILYFSIWATFLWCNRR